MGHLEQRAHRGGRTSSSSTTRPGCRVQGRALVMSATPGWNGSELQRGDRASTGSGPRLLALQRC